MGVDVPMQGASGIATGQLGGAADREWQAERKRAAWRRLLLPLAGRATLLFIWWVLVAVFHVRPFIVPLSHLRQSTGRY